MKIACLQINQIWENRSANYDLYQQALANLPSCDLMVLPEMFDTGFTMNTSLAEEFHQSQGLSFLCNLAKQKKSAIYTSLMTKENNRFFNRGVFVYPTGVYEYYDKNKLFGLGGEDQVYTSGTSQKIVTLNDWKIKLHICYDLRFPEISRNKIVNNKAAFDFCIYVANWPSKRIKHWEALLRARAIENQCYVLGLNRIGLDGNQLEYSGGSVCFDPNGEAAWTSNLNNQDLGNFELDLENLNLFRQTMPFLKDAE